MTENNILSRQNTLWMQGVSALLIMLMHFVMQLEDYPRFFNIFVSVAVAVFLFISGFGINESHKINGINNFWKKRFLRVIIPCWTIFLFQLPFVEHFNSVQLLKNLTFYASDLWFVDYIIRWYLVYWISRRFFTKNTKYILFVFGIYNVFQQQLYSEQAFSFFCGYLASEYVGKLNKLNKKHVLKYTCLSVIYGIIFLLIKEIPTIQQIKGSILFNVILLNIKLPLAMSIIAAPFLFPLLKKIGIFNKLGKISYELYIVHYNFMPAITGIISIFIYSAYSIIISVILRRINQFLSKKSYFIYSLTGILYIGICYTLMCKYSMRVTEHYGYICIGYALVLALDILFFATKEEEEKKINKYLPYLFAATTTVLVIGLLIVQYHFDPLTNKVDRWSALAYPIQNLFNGQFPYSAKTHLGGNASPFPIWLVFHIPFYLLQNVGLSEIFTCMIFIYSIKLLSGYKAAIKATLLLFLSINLWYEVAVRSDLISNFFPLAAFINILQVYQINFKQHPWILSVCVGLWLSTRLSVAFPLFILFFPYYIKLKVKKQILIPLLIVGVFAMTFLPLILWDAKELFGAENNPFSLQFRQGSPIATIFLVTIALTMSLTWKGSYQFQVLYSVIILLLIPIISYGYSMYIYGNWTDIFNSNYDITYIDAAIPFAITILSLPKLKG